MPSDLTPEQRRVLPLIFAVTLTSIMGNSLLSPAIPDILDTFDRPDSAAGFLVASASLPGVVVAPVIGLLADRWGRREVLVPCLAIFGAAGLFVAVAPTFELMLAGRLVMGFGAAGLVNLAVVLISDFFPADQQTHWIGRNAGVLTLALALFPVLAGLITNFAGWRWALVPYSIGMVTAVAAWLILDATPAPVVRRTVRDQLAGFGVALRDTTIIATMIAGAIAFAVMFGVFLATLPNHLEDEFGLSAGWRGVVLGLPAVTSSLAAFNLRRIRSRIASGSLLILTGIGWIVAFSLIGLSTVLVLLLVGTLVFGAGEGVLIPTLQDIALRRAPDDLRASVLASWTGAARLGQTLGPLMASAIVAGAGSTWALLSGALGALAMLVTFLITPVRREA